MTIPIIPGPFSFLAEAGQAAGAVGTSIQQKKARRRAEAQKNIENLLALVNSGRVSPSVLNKPEAMVEFRAAGIPVPQTVNLELGAPGGAGIGGAPGVPISLHTPDTFTPSAEDRIQQLTKQALAGPLSPQQQAAVTKVPTPAAALAGETRAVAEATQATGQAAITGEQARAAPAEANAAITAADTHTQIFEGVKKMFNNDPDFARLAMMAATGTLGVEIAKMDANRYNLSIGRQQAIDTARVYLDALNDMNNETTRKQTDWDNGRQQAFREAQANGENTADPQVAQQIVKTYQATAGKAPTYESIRDEYLKVNFGTDFAGFQRALKAVAPAIGLALGNVQPATTDAGQAGKTAPPPATQIDPIDYAAQQMIKPPAKADGSVYTPQELVHIALNHGFTRAQLSKLYAALKAGGADPALLRGIGGHLLSGAP